MIGCDKLSFPKEWGGWGIKNILWFNTTLRMKSYWRDLSGNTLWYDVLKRKYIKMNLFYWIRKPPKTYINCSPISNGFTKVYNRASLNLCWKVGNCKNIIVGNDPIIGLEEDYKLSSNISNYLVDIGYTTLAQIRRPIWRNRDCSYWLTTKYLGLIQDSTI